MARIYGSTNSSQWGLFVDLTETSYSIANNTSEVQAKVYLYRTSSASYYGGTATISVTVDGTSKSVTYNPSYPTNIGAGESNAKLAGTFSYTVGHNSDGKKSASMSMSWSANFTPSSGSASGSLTLTTIPRKANLNSAPNFMDDENPTITYTNSAGNSVSSLDACISFTGAKDDIKYRAISKTGTSYTFELTDAEREVLRKATLSGSNKRTVIFYVRTVIGGNTYYSTLDRTFTVANANPTLTATMEDINEATLALTQDSSVVIKDKSLVRITPTATALKDASITKITVNGVTVNGSYIDLAGADKYEVIATDNRGLTGKYTFQSESTSIANYFKFINYNSLTLNATFSRKAPTTGEVKVDYSGNYFNNKFSENVDNTLSVKYRYKEKNEEWTGEETWYDLSPELKENTFENDETLEQLFDYQTNFTFELKAEDLLSSITITEITVTKGIPIVNWGEDYFNVNGDILKNGQPLNDGDTLPIGAIVNYNGTTVPEGYTTVGNDYSTTEINTGQTWIDGKPIYRKVINFGSLPNTSIKNVSTDLLINEVNIVNYYGTAQGQSGALKYVLHLPDIFVDTPTQSIRLTINTQNNKYNITIQAGSDRSNYDAFVVIEYTKTTD